MKFQILKTEPMKPGVNQEITEESLLEKFDFGTAPEEVIIRRKVGVLNRRYMLKHMETREQIPLSKILCASKRGIPASHRDATFPVKTIPINLKTVHPISEIERSLHKPTPEDLPLSRLQLYYQEIKNIIPDSYLERLCIRRIREYYRRK